MMNRAGPDRLRAVLMLTEYQERLLRTNLNARQAYHPRNGLSVAERAGLIDQALSENPLLARAFNALDPKRHPETTTSTGAARALSALVSTLEAERARERRGAEWLELCLAIGYLRAVIGWIRETEVRAA